MSVDLLKQLDGVFADARGAIAGSKTDVELESVEIDLLGRKQGSLTGILKLLSTLDDESKRTVGARANQIKTEIESLLAARRAEIAALSGAGAIDISEPVLPAPEYGALHPITMACEDLSNFFRAKGFLVLDGPELESDFYNFEALNIPADHPARDMQDTFYIKDHPTWVMRTHTSCVQIRAMMKYGAPLAMVAPGRCFRNEATDVRHEHTFFQFEGMVIGENITIQHLKGMLESMAQHLFGVNTKVRLRPKFYPFVEPGMNGEVTCTICGGVGCKLCKGTGWLEIIGCGMIHPEVLRAGGIDPKKYSGFAFGPGLTRMAMLKYGIDDVREFNAGDLNFLQQ
ncbi:MAG: phenylalanine--tRNA ligase subunit alpha [Candidatus Magasanikbacteria bacterium]|nr:phenylalanine--tRNA ligase subunit alpha [Candidatus Magasanikbacteria bacterium]